MDGVMQTATQFRLLPVSNGKAWAKVSPEDYERLAQYRWLLYGNGYAFRWTPRNHYARKAIMMHREVTNAPAGQEVDHINSDKLDNTRGNLRFATREQNQQRARSGPRSSSGYRGVRLTKGRWAARVRHSKREISLGTYDTREEAARAYDAAALRIYGPLAFVNFRDA
jgi:hypothetical protein